MGGRGSLRQDGYLVVSGPDGTTEHDSLQCRHCGGHFLVVPGSGKRRGWCLMCSGPTCGKEGCVQCMPFEKRLEAFERRERLFRALQE